MDKKTRNSVLALLGCWALCLGFAAAAEHPAAPEVEMHDGNMAMSFAAQAAGERLVLTVSGPGDLRVRKAFEAGTTPVFDLFDKAGNPYPDGGYAWELRSAPVEGTRVRGMDAPAIAKRSPAVASGYFAVADGRFVAADGVEEIPVKDIVHLDDVIIDGSLCVGNDCYQDYDFGYDTIVLRENNLRIFFEDTSTIAGYPTNDWRITVNDSTSGGADRFSIEDADEVSTPFTIEAGAPDHSLYVEDMGRIGLGTSTPYVEIHVVDGDSPTLRLEQDGSFGFTPQTWDITSNESNFFIRDATGGSRLPFRIQPGAPTSSLTIRDTGYVGVGSWDPDDMLHVEAGGSVLPGIRIVNTDADNDGWSFRVVDADEFRISKQSVSGAEFKIDASGNVTIKGTLTVRDGEADEETYPDYVFEPGYPLMPLAELRAFVEENRHLPEIPPASELTRNGLNMTEMQIKLLEKMEEMTLYTLDQQETIRAQQSTIHELRARLTALEQVVGAEQ
ncbi:MAG: hypothetical protein GY856_11500 [bacterium]|nr:hypothetical protein [bacterium]